MERGVGRGWLFKGGDYFQYFHQRGAFWYSREAINGGTAIIQGNTVLIPLSRDFICAEFLVRPWFGDFISRMGCLYSNGYLERVYLGWTTVHPALLVEKWAQIQTRMISSIQAHGMILLAWCLTAALVLELHPVFLSIKKKTNQAVGIRTLCFLG